MALVWVSLQQFVFTYPSWRVFTTWVHAGNFLQVYIREDSFFAFSRRFYLHWIWKTMLLHVYHCKVSFGEKNHKIKKVWRKCCHFFPDHRSLSPWRPSCFLWEWLRSYGWSICERSKTISPRIHIKHFRKNFLSTNQRPQTVHAAKICFHFFP